MHLNKLVALSKYFYCTKGFIAMSVKIKETSAKVRSLYRKFNRLLLWWPEQLNDDESAFKNRAVIQVQERFRSNFKLSNGKEIKSAIEYGEKEYEAFIRTASNYHRNNV